MINRNSRPTCSHSKCLFDLRLLLHARQGIMQINSDTWLCPPSIPFSIVNLVFLDTRLLNTRRHVSLLPLAPTTVETIETRKCGAEY